MAGSLGFASRLGGRGSVTAEQASAQMYNSGIVSGFVISPATPTANMTVRVGGVAGTPDVMVATNAVGNNVFLKNRNTDAFTLSMTAPASNSIIYSIVGFTDDLSIATTDATSISDNPSKCGLIAVAGTSAASPVAPSAAQIRTAITSAGFTGSQAAYGVLGYVTLTSTTTTITAPNISQAGRTTPLSVAKLNGGSTAGVLASDSSGNITPAAIKTYTKSGDGGGAGFYVDMGSLKMCWGRTGNVNLTGASTKSISFPAGLFTAIQSANYAIYGNSVFASQLGGAPSNNSMSVYFSGTPSGTVSLTWFAIGA